jgi:translation initiation factor 2B subunit (eIF-2B alpha/beta/delta family)
MTNCQEKYLIEMNSILALLYLNPQSRFNTCKALDMQYHAFDHRVKHLIKAGFLTREGHKRLSVFTSHVKEYPIKEYEKHCDIVSYKHIATKDLKPKPAVKSTRKLSTAKQVIYNNKYDQLISNYTLIEPQHGRIVVETMAHSFERFKSPKVYVGNMWGMMV